MRVPVGDGSWPARLPPAPRGHVLTVTLGAPELRRVPADDLVSSGYRIVGTAEAGARFVDVLVPAGPREQDPGWWERLLAVAERVFDLRMGPVLHVLGPELEPHLRADCAGRP